MPLPSGKNLSGRHLPEGPLGVSVTNLALLACVGVGEEGFREVLAVEVAGTEKDAAYASLLRGLLDRGLKGVHLEGVMNSRSERVHSSISFRRPFPSGLCGALLTVLENTFKVLVRRMEKDGGRVRLNPWLLKKGGGSGRSFSYRKKLFLRE